VHKWVELGRVQSFILTLGWVRLGHFTCGSGRVEPGQENWTHVQLCFDIFYKQQLTYKLIKKPQYTKTISHQKQQT